MSGRLKNAHGRIDESLSGLRTHDIGAYGYGNNAACINLQLMSVTSVDSNQQVSEWTNGVCGPVGRRTVFPRRTTP